MDEYLFDENFTDYLILDDIYASSTEIEDVLDSTGTLYDVTFTGYVALCLYDNFLFDKIAYSDTATFEYRLASRMRQVAPLLFKKYQYYNSLVDSSTTSDEFVKTGGMLSQRETDVVVTGASFQKTANTPTKITPTDTTDFTSAYTNYQGKVNTDHTSNEDSSTSINRHGGTEELFKLLDKLPRSLYDEVCMLFASHFLTIYN